MYNLKYKKKKVIEETCPMCNGDSEELMGDEWEGGRHEKCDYCDGQGTIETYRGLKVINSVRRDENVD